MPQNHTIALINPVNGKFIFRMTCPHLYWSGALAELPLPCSPSRSFELFLPPSSLRLRVHRLFCDEFVCSSVRHFIPVPKTFSTSSEQTQGRRKKARNGPARIRDEPSVHRGNREEALASSSHTSIYFKAFFLYSSVPNSFFMYAPCWMSILRLSSNGDKLLTGAKRPGHLKAKKLTTFAPWLPFFLCFLTKSIPPKKAYLHTQKFWPKAPYILIMRW